MSSLYSSREESAASPADLKPQHGQPVALDGLCPVTLVESGKAVLGKPFLWWNYAGHTYYFAYPRQALAFMDNPSRYVPAAEEIRAGTSSGTVELAHRENLGPSAATASAEAAPAQRDSHRPRKDSNGRSLNPGV